MNIIDKIKYWWAIRKYPKALKTFPVTEDIYCIQLKNGKAHYIQLPKEKDAYPIEYAKFLRECATAGFKLPNVNDIHIDEEKIKNKDKDWLDDEDKDPEDLI